VCVYELFVSMLIVILHILRTGACGGELACSTCHLIFEKNVYDTLPKMEEEEEDMLDLAFEVTETYVQYIVRNGVAVAAFFIPSPTTCFSHF
jgi:ferredoxin